MVPKASSIEVENMTLGVITTSTRETVDVVSGTALFVGNMGSPTVVLTNFGTS